MTDVHVLIVVVIFTALSLPLGFAVQVSMKREAGPGCDFERAHLQGSCFSEGLPFVGGQCGLEGQKQRQLVMLCFIAPAKA